MAARRWFALVVAALLVSAASIYGALAGLRRAVALEDAMAAGEAMQVFRVASRPLREVYDHADADLERALANARPLGACYVAVVDHGETVLASAGDAVVFPIGAEGLSKRSGGRYRYVGSVVSPPVALEAPTRPPPPNWVPPQPPPGGFYAPNRRLLVEFEPLKAYELRDAAIMQLWLTVAGSACLVLMAMLAGRGRERAGAAADRREQQRRAAQRGELATAMAHDAIGVTDREQAERRMVELDEAVRNPARYVSTDVATIVDAAIGDSGRRAERGRWRVRGPFVVEPAGLRWAVRRILAVVPKPPRASATESDDGLALDFIDDADGASRELGARPGLVAVSGWAAMHDATLAAVEVDGVPCLRLGLPRREPS